MSIAETDPLVSYTGCCETVTQDGGTHTEVTKLEQQNVIRFLLSEGVRAIK